MQVLNLYAGLGGNRFKWPDTVSVTAIENDPLVADIYQENFPQDRVIIADAHQYLIDHCDDYDFVWSSPPCPSHSQLQLWTRHDCKQYPDMTLYQQILWLRHRYKGNWAVENVQPYYPPLIPAQAIQRHLFWANFHIIEPPLPETRLFTKDNKSSSMAEKRRLCRALGIPTDIRLPVRGTQENKDNMQALRNCVHPEIGYAVLMSASNQYNPAYTQPDIFDQGGAA